MNYLFGYKKEGKPELKNDDNKVLKPTKTKYDKSESDPDSDTEDGISHVEFEDLEGEEKSDVKYREYDEIGEIVYKSRNMSMYSVHPTKIIENINKWSHNRALNHKHIKTIAEGIKETKRLVGSLKAVKDENKSIMLIDGHHRQRALEIVFKENSDFNMDDVILEVYEVEDFDSEEVLNLFNVCNNIRNIPDSEMPNLTCMNLMKKLKEKFPKLIVKSEVCHRPALSEVTLTRKLKQIIRTFNLTKEQMYNLIIEKNREYKEKPRQFFFPNEKREHREKHKTIYDKASDGTLYLGIKENREYYWLTEIVDGLKQN